MKHLPQFITGGYALIICCIIITGYAYYYEWVRLESLEEQNRVTNKLQEDLNEFNLSFSEFLLTSEGSSNWNEKDKIEYNQRHAYLDSILYQFQNSYPNERIDTVRYLLGDKTRCILEISEILKEQRTITDKITQAIPTIARKSAMDQPSKQKRKGFLGIFGKKEEIKPTATTAMLKSLNKYAISQQSQHSLRLSVLTDSLVDRNRQLNFQLGTFIRQLEDQVQYNIQQRELEISSMRDRAYKQMGTMSVILIVLLTISYIVIIRNIHIREQGRKKLEGIVLQNKSLLEMRKKIILTISHDIRGPLNVISGSAELAIDTRDKRKRDGYLNNARYLCRHVVHLLNNLLDVYRLNEAKETPNNVPFRLNILFDRIAIGAAQIINDKGLLFKHDYRNLDMSVIGDEDRIEQIADNLLSNAVKFTQSGSVGIAASYEDGRLIMDISDTGIGMSEETVDRIFRPFERADNVEHVEGFGLGLSITKGLVTMLGGTINVISNVGKGTTFHIAIPLELTGNIESSSIPEVKPVGILRLPHNVIVIDDDPLQRDIISEMLERNAISCTVCTTASDVVKAMRERDYDILLTDINMPGTNGFALLELLRKSNIGNSRTIPVVAMTARDDDENRPLIQCGFSGCIFKPFSMQELLERISIIMAESLPLGEDRIDFSPLIANVANPVVILQGLADSTSDDIAELKGVAIKSDKKAISSVLHRIKPVWEMLGIESRLQPLRNAVKKRSSTTADIESLVADVISVMENLIENINEELETIKYEEQDTDS